MTGDGEEQFGGGGAEPQPGEPMAEEVRRAAEILWRLPELIALLHADGYWLWASTQFQHLAGRDIAAGASFGDRIHPNDVDRVRQVLSEVVDSPGQPTDVVARVWAEPLDRWVVLEAQVTSYVHEPLIGGILISARDATERYAASQALRRAATTDPLTGLPNRLMLLDRLETALARLDRRGQCFAVLFLDLDDFKKVNDALGHVAGDALLVDVAHRLRGRLRAEDTLARLGGDEFIVVAEAMDIDAADQSVAVLCGSILEEIERPISVAGRTLHISASIGVVIVGEHTVTDDILRDADVAMYEAKASGRGRWVLHDEAMSQRVRARLDQQELLTGALAEDRVVPLFQPIVDAIGGAIVGAEAVAAIRDADGSVRPAAAYLGVAEDSGLIVRLGEQILRGALAAAAGWPPERYVAVNISARQLSEPGVEDLVADLLASSAVAPGRLVLEVTEAAVFVRRHADALARLHEMGVRFAIDDFGSGFVSLDHLRRLPVTIVKLHRSVVAEAIADPSGATVIRAVGALADAFGLTVVADGVDDAVIERMLLDHGIRYMQGGHYGALEGVAS